MPLADERLKAIKRRHRERIFSMAGVRSFGIEEDSHHQPCFKVRVLNGHEETEKALPTILEGVPVYIERTDDIVKRDS